MEYIRVSFAVILVTSTLVSRAVTGGGEEEEVAAASPAGCNIPAIYNFGDSNSDTGGISAAFPPSVPPNGETYFHRPAGRASDGRLIVDFIAEHLGLPHLSAYLNSIKPNFEHGANFATGGATIRPQNESWFQNYVSPFSLDIQVQHYLQIKTQTTYIYNNQANEQSERSKIPRPEDFSKALYTFDIGQNDLNACFRKLSIQQTWATIPDIIKQFSVAVQKLYEQGARAFWIHNTGPIGCLPAATANIRHLVPGSLDEHGCVKYQNDIAVEFNKQLKDSVMQLRAEFPQAALTYVDMYTAKHKLITNAKNQGFEDAFKICCGYRKNGINIWCGYKANVNGTEMYAGSCPSPSTVISWDSVHYTEAANRWIANQIVNGSLSDPPIPITQACHKHMQLK